MYSRRACLVAWGAAAPLGGPGGAPRAPIPGGGTIPGGWAVASAGAAGGGAPMPPPGIGTPVSPSGGTSNSVGRRRWRRGISVGERDRDRRGIGGRRSRLRLRSRRDRSSSSLRSLWRRMHGKGGGKGKVSDTRRECLGSCRARLVTTRYARDPVVDRRVDETTKPPIDRAGRFDFSRAQDGDGLAARTIPGRGGRPCTCRRGVHIARQTWRKRSARGGRPYPRGASSDLEQPDPASERIRARSA